MTPKPSQTDRLLAMLRAGSDYGTGFPDRFAAKVNACQYCWEWTGAKSGGGYGQIKAAGVVIYAHRVMYEAANGPIAAGLHIDHLCRNRGCVNPDHLEAVRPNVNSRRGSVSKLTVEQIAEIRSSALSMRAVARQMGVTSATVNYYRNGRGARIYGVIA